MTAHDCVIPLQADMVGVYRCSCGALWAQEEISGVWRRVPLLRMSVVLALVLVAGGVLIGKIAFWRLDFDGLSALVVTLLVAAAMVACAPRAVRS